MQSRTTPVRGAAESPASGSCTSQEATSGPPSAALVPGRTCSHSGQQCTLPNFESTPCGQARRCTNTRLLGRVTRRWRQCRYHGHPHLHLRHQPHSQPHPPLSTS
eukprot:s1984_g7.t1